MKQVSFEEIGAVVATFQAQEGVKAGQVVKITGNGQVGPCGAGESFCGVALSCEDGYAGVQVSGFAAVAVSGAAALGWTELTADGAGGVKTAAQGDAGSKVLVVEMDQAGERAVVCL